MLLLPLTYKNPCYCWLTRVCCHTLIKPDCLAPLQNSTMSYCDRPCCRRGLDADTTPLFVLLFSGYATNAHKKDNTVILVHIPEVATVTTAAASKFFAIKKIRASRAVLLSYVSVVVVISPRLS